jgi:Phage gp6-like head-tail connector protein
MDLSQVKNLLGISSDKHDSFITEMLPIVTEFAKDHCNNSFLIGGAEELPGGVKLFIARAIQFNMNPAGVIGRSMGGASYSYDTDYPPSIMRLLRPYKKVRFV